MAKSGTIKLVINYNKDSICALDVLKKLLGKGWNLNYNSTVSYLPLKDEDFNWCFDNIKDENKVFHIIHEKVQNQELVGITLMWENTDIGVNALFYPSLSEISFSTEINRKLIENLDITDYTWYIEKLIPCILILGLSIEVMECIDG